MTHPTSWKPTTNTSAINQKSTIRFLRRYVPSSCKKSIQLTGFLTCKHFVIWPVSIFQNRIVSSYEPLIRRLPFKSSEVQ